LQSTVLKFVSLTHVNVLGTLRYEDGNPRRARMETAVDAGNSRESRSVAKVKIFKIYFFRIVWQRQ